MGSVSHASVACYLFEDVVMRSVGHASVAGHFLQAVAIAGLVCAIVFLMRFGNKFFRERFLLLFESKLR